MRPVILIAAFALASCGGNGTANNAIVSEESGNDELTAVNDVTAIDAATGQAAEMAADVNYTFNEAANATANNAAANSATNASD